MRSGQISFEVEGLLCSPPTFMSAICFSSWSPSTVPRSCRTAVAANIRAITPHARPELLWDSKRLANVLAQSLKTRMREASCSGVRSDSLGSAGGRNTLLVMKTREGSSRVCKLGMLGVAANSLSGARSALDGSPMLRQSRWEERNREVFCRGEVVLKELEEPALP